MTEDPGKPSRNLTCLLATILTLSLILFVVFGLVMSGLFGLEKAGQIGDTFGAANALFSLLAFVGLIYNLHLQREELALQRKELELTREELKGQKEQLEAQNETLRASNKHQVLTSIMAQYASVEMQLAIRYLWEYSLSDRNTDQVVIDFGSLKTKTGPSTTKNVNDQASESPYCRRQTVKAFFMLITEYYRQKVISPDDLRACFSKAELEIIPKILIPIENAIRDKRPESAADPAILDRMLKLYEDYPDLTANA